MSPKCVDSETTTFNEIPFPSETGLAHDSIRRGHGQGLVRPP